MNDVIILAGGLGTRLAHVVADTQKTMAPVGGEPFLLYLVKHLVGKGCKKIVFAVSYHHEQIENRFGSRFEGAEILYSVENEPMGTGGAIKRALSLCDTENVLIFNGDTFFDADLDALMCKHTASGAYITLAARELENVDRSGTLEADGDGRITAFAEKKKLDRALINGGIYAVRRDIAGKLPDGKFSFEKDVLEKLVFPVYCTVSDGYFIDIGVPSDYFRAQTEIPLKFGQKRFKAAFLDRDGVICREKHHLYKTEDFEFINGVPRALSKLREKGYLIFVITNQAGIAKGYYTEKDVEILHDYMCKLLDGTVYFDGIYYSPYHPEGIVEKYRKESDDRKPGTGMIKKAEAFMASRGMELDYENSVLVGDTENDILTGINAGIGSNFLVRSGHAIPDEKKSKADGIFDDLAAAVDHI